MTSPTAALLQAGQDRFSLGLQAPPADPQIECLVPERLTPKDHLPTAPWQVGFGNFGGNTTGSGLPYLSGGTRHRWSLPGRQCQMRLHFPVVALHCTRSPPSKALGAQLTCRELTLPVGFRTPGPVHRPGFCGAWGSSQRCILLPGSTFRPIWRLPGCPQALEPLRASHCSSSFENPFLPSSST